MFCKQLTSAHVASEFYRRNQAWCTKLGLLTKVVLILKLLTLTQIAFIYPVEYLKREHFRRNLWPSKLVFWPYSPFERTLLTKSCLDKVQLVMLFSLTSLLIVKGKSLRLIWGFSLNSKILHLPYKDIMARRLVTCKLRILHFGNITALRN